MSSYRIGLKHVRQRNEIISVRPAILKRMEVNGESGWQSKPNLCEWETLIVKTNGIALDSSVPVSQRFLYCLSFELLVFRAATIR